MPVDGEILLVLAVHVTDADAGLEGEAPADGKHVAVAEPHRLRFTPIAPGSVLQIVPRESAEHSDVMPVPGFPGPEPVAAFGTDGRELVIPVSAVVLPPGDVALQIDRPAVVDTVLHLQRGHQHRIV